MKSLLLSLLLLAGTTLVLSQAPTAGYFAGDPPAPAGTAIRFAVTPGVSPTKEPTFMRLDQWTGQAWMMIPITQPSGKRMLYWVAVSELEAP